MAITKFELKNPILALRWREGAVQLWKDKRQKDLQFGNRDGARKARLHVTELRREIKRIKVRF